MRRIVHFVMRASAVLALCAAAAIALTAQTFTVLVNFDGTNGAFPSGALVQAANGDLYGVTSEGAAGSSTAFGSIFKVTAGGALTSLYDFCAQTGCPDGEKPAAGLVLANNGNFYGTTSGGGVNGGGTIFKFTPGGQLTTLYSFCAQPACADGKNPNASLIQATNGNLYGTTYRGGAQGSGTVFKVTLGGNLTTIYNFCSQVNCTDGASPAAGLVEATNGNLYGTTASGGSNSEGTIFKMTPGGTLTTLYRFCGRDGCTNGANPYAALVQASDGDLYGTAAFGGANGAGAIFKITPGGKVTGLYSFCPQEFCPDGANPRAPLIQATDGNLYGGTDFGVNGAEGGTIFQITTDGVLTTLYSFCPGDICNTGATIVAALVQDTNGTLYGTTPLDGGSRGGTLFSLNVGLAPFVETVPATGKVGAKVTILGTALTGASSVTFNGAVASFTVNGTGSAITTTVPAGATSGTVEVVTPGGTLSSNVVFRVQP